MRQIPLLIVLCVLCSCTRSQTTTSEAPDPGTAVTATHREKGAEGFPYRAIFIDPATEKEFGPFPFDRTLIARGIRELDKMDVRAIIVLYFLDLPRSDSGDADLANAITQAKAKIILEATVNRKEEKPNALPPRFNLDLSEADHDLVVLGGDHGWIPRPSFSEHAYDVGFSDLRSSEYASMIEKYEGKYVKGLFACALEAGMNAPARVLPGETLTIAHHKLRLTQYSEITIDPPPQDSLESFSYGDLLNGRLRKEMFKDRVVILGYDSPKSNMLDTKIGRVPAAHWFFHMLKSCYEKVNAAPLVGIV